jgi:hypothetical protein
MFESFEASRLKLRNLYQQCTVCKDFSFRFLTIQELKLYFSFFGQILSLYFEKTNIFLYV